MESNARFMLVRPLTFPDFCIELTCPVTRASSNRLGSITVTVNRSPTRDSLLDKVSLIRTFRSVPTGTNGTTRFVVVLFFVVCALVSTAPLTSAMIVKRAIVMACCFFMVVLLIQSEPRTARAEAWGSEGQCCTVCFGGAVRQWFIVESALAVDAAVAFEDVSRRGLAHDDVL